LGSLPVAEEGVEQARPSVEPAPADSEDEPDGLGSLSVDEGGPEDGGDASRRDRRRRRVPRVETSSGRPRPTRRFGCDRVGRAVWLAPTVTAGPVALESPCVREPQERT